MKLTSGNLNRGSVNPEKLFPDCLIFLSCQQRAVGVIRPSAGDPGQDTVKPRCFLLPVKRRLQGKRQGCGGRIRPRAGSVQRRQPPVSHAQSLQPPVSPGGCGCLGTRKSALFTPSVMWVTLGGFLVLLFLSLAVFIFQFFERKKNLCFVMSDQIFSSC